MTLEQVYNRINNYLRGTSTQPILVDVANVAQQEDLLRHFCVNGTDKMTASEFCPDDELPQWDKLIYELRTREGKAIIVGLCAFLRLEGKEALTRKLRQIIDVEGCGKTIIVTIGCRDWLKRLCMQNPRLTSSGRISTLDGEADKDLTLCFLAPNLTEPGLCVQGINDLPKITSYPHSDVIIVTKHHSSDYPNSLFAIKDYRSTYQILIADFSELNQFEESFATPAQWKYLYNELSNASSFIDILIKFGGKQALSTAFYQFDKFTENDKWLYLICLKVYGAQDNKYLTRAAAKSNSIHEFIEHICNDILEVSAKNGAFQEMYRERKALLGHIGQYPDIIDRYCKRVLGKEKDAIHYLTDSTLRGRESIIHYLSLHGKTLGRNKVLPILTDVYPALSTYLEDYSYGHPLLDRYFKLYKFDKVTNSISDELEEIVVDQATKRQFNTILMPRTSIVDSLKKDGAVLFFMDALGGEYMSYIQSRFFENGFNFKGRVARCELPSITSVNKSFVEEFKQHDCQIVSRKDLDELKHTGENSYNYESSKLPIHLVKELEIIDSLIDHIKATLDKGKTAFIIADHGSSRLAVIKETENKWEMSQKGLHSGRCCPISDVDTKPDYATEDNDFWCLANYDRFKGGRKAQVEVHGGALLEEVTVPVIEVSKRDKNIACEVKNNGPLTRSHKVAPILNLFVESDVNDISIELDGKFYKSLGTEIPYIHKFELSGIKSNGKYKFNVYSNGAMIAKNLEIEIVSQGARERSFF